MFCYTVSGAYECALKLYELEEKLTDLNFMKANRSCLFNFHFVRKIENDLNRTLLLTLENGCQVEVSRQYAGAVRKKLEEYHG
jgi:DNA-binding LytR/AlgR family response regulator